MSSISQFQFEQMQARLALNRHEAVPPPALEKDLHQDIMDYCERKWPRWLYFHGSTAHRTKRVLGEPDFQIYGDRGRFWLIEVKRADGKLSPAQMGAAMLAEKLGHKIHVVRSMDDFLKLVDEPRHGTP